MPCVYKITRQDDLEYIGITVNKKVRFKSHEKSKRFESGIKYIEILAEVDSYEEAEELEEFFIDKYNTYECGLNLTPKGKGLNEDCKFNTFGHKFSEESRKRMSDAAKKRIEKYGPNKPTFTEETRKKLSEQRKGKIHKRNLMFTWEQIKEMRELYESQSFDIPDSIIKEVVKKRHLDLIDKESVFNLTTKNGKPVTYQILFCKAMAQKYGTYDLVIRNIIKGNAYNEEYQHHTKQ